MRYILLFTLSFLALNASKILSYNIYDRTMRTDVMITFDTPYHGRIKQSLGNNKIIIKLEETSIESAKIKQIGSKYLKSITITPMKGYTQIVASVPSSVHFIASKTSDAYGLRLRFVTKNTIQHKQTNTSTSYQNNPLSALPTKKSDDLSSSYYIVVTILFIGIIILFILKKKITKHSKQNNPWLFANKTQKKQQQTTPTTQSTQPQQPIGDSNEIAIRFQKQLNADNSVVMLDFGEQSYLVLLGKSNILLDKFHDDKPITQDDFETILQSRHKELEQFLSSEKPQESRDFQTTQDAFSAYKERAAISHYDEL